MKRPEDAFNAIKEPNPCIDGRKANVNLAVIGAKPRSIPGGRLWSDFLLGERKACHVRRESGKPRADNERESPSKQAEVILIFCFLFSFPLYPPPPPPSANF